MSTFVEERAPVPLVATPRPWWLAPDFVGLTELWKWLLSHPTHGGAEASARHALAWSLAETTRLLMTFGPHSAAREDARLRLRVQDDGSARLAFEMEMITSESATISDPGLVAPRRETRSRLAAELVEVAALRSRIVRALPDDLGQPEASARNAFGQMLLACEGFLERFAASLEGPEGEDLRVRPFPRERDTTRLAWSLRILRFDDPAHIHHELL